MIRALIVAGLIIGVLATLVFLPQWLNSQSPGQATAAQDAGVCDLLAGDCEWTTAEGRWRVRLTPEGAGDQGTEFQLTVAAPEAPSRFLAVLAGESMYMGEYPVPLKQSGDGLWQARFTAPFCTTGEPMTWRLALKSGQTPIAVSPHKLVFEAH